MSALCQKRTSHVLLVRVLRQIDREQHDGLIAGILPPMRDFTRLRDHVARLVHDRNGAVVSIFFDFTLDDVNDVRPICMAVLRHGAVRLDGELSHTKQAILNVCRLLFYIDNGDDSVGDTDILPAHGRWSLFDRQGTRRLWRPKP